jgi:hypothetical protein
MHREDAFERMVGVVGMEVVIAMSRVLAASSDLSYKYSLRERGRDHRGTIDRPPFWCELWLTH